MNTVKEKFENIKTTAVNKVTDLKTKVFDTFNNLKTSISNVITNIKTTIVSGFQNAIDFIKSLPQQAINWGRDIINGVVDGIRNAIGKVRDVMGDVASAISSFIHFSEPDEGPLSNFHTYMPDMMKQLAQGIKSGIPQIESAMDAMARSMIPTMEGGVSGAAGGNITNANTNTVNINVYGAQGQNVRELANEIQTIINNEVYSKGAVFA